MLLEDKYKPPQIPRPFKVLFPGAGIIYNRSYPMDEIQSILDQSKLEESKGKKDALGLEITGKKRQYLKNMFGAHYYSKKEE
ncbi:MAG: hypothetical protein ACXVI0_06165 [Halobacteriota archaeon]